MKPYLSLDPRVRLRLLKLDKRPPLVLPCPSFSNKETSGTEADSGSFFWLISLKFLGPWDFQVSRDMEPTLVTSKSDL